jgi:hypothetical protein
LLSFSFWAQSASRDFDWTSREPLASAHIVAQIGSLLRSSICDIAVRNSDWLLNRTPASLDSYKAAVTNLTAIRRANNRLCGG